MTSRARAMTLLRGYTAEAEDAYAEALALVKEHGEVPQLFPVLRSLASFHGFRGEFDKGIEYAHGDPPSSPTPRTTRACGSTATRSSARTPGSPGDIDDRPRLPRPGDRHVRERRLPPRRLRLGLDPRVSCLTTSGFFLWLLGYPDRAVGAGRPGGRARDRARPSVLARVRLLPRRVPPSLASRAGASSRSGRTSALRVAETSDLPIWRALATVSAGRRDERPRPARRRASARWPTASISTRACGRRRSSGR